MVDDAYVGPEKVVPKEESLDVAAMARDRYYRNAPGLVMELEPAVGLEPAIDLEPLDAPFILWRHRDRHLHGEDTEIYNDIDNQYWREPLLAENVQIPVQDKLEDGQLDTLKYQSALRWFPLYKDRVTEYDPFEQAIYPESVFDPDGFGVVTLPDNTLLLYSLDSKDGTWENPVWWSFYQTADGKTYTHLGYMAYEMYMPGFYKEYWLRSSGSKVVMHSPYAQTPNGPVAPVHEDMHVLLTDNANSTYTGRNVVLCKYNLQIKILRKFTWIPGAVPEDNGWEHEIYVYYGEDLRCESTFPYNLITPDPNETYIIDGPRTFTSQDNTSFYSFRKPDNLIYWDDHIVNQSLAAGSYVESWRLHDFNPETRVFDIPVQKICDPLPQWVLQNVFGNDWNAVLEALQAGIYAVGTGSQWTYHTDPEENYFTGNHIARGQRGAFNLSVTFRAVLPAEASGSPVIVEEVSKIDLKYGSATVITEFNRNWMPYTCMCGHQEELDNGAGPYINDYFYLPRAYLGDTVVLGKRKHCQTVPHESWPNAHTDPFSGKKIVPQVTTEELSAERFVTIDHGVNWQESTIDYGWEAVGDTAQYNTMPAGKNPNDDTYNPYLSHGPSGSVNLLEIVGVPVPGVSLQYVREWKGTAAELGFQVPGSDPPVYYFGFENKGLLPYNFDKPEEEMFDRLYRIYGPPITSLYDGTGAIVEIEAVYADDDPTPVEERWVWNGNYTLYPMYHEVDPVPEIPKDRWMRAHAFDYQNVFILDEDNKVPYNTHNVPEGEEAKPYPINVKYRRFYYEFALQWYHYWSEPEGSDAYPLGVIGHLPMRGARGTFLNPSGDDDYYCRIGLRARHVGTDEYIAPVDDEEPPTKDLRISTASTLPKAKEGNYYFMQLVKSGTEYPPFTWIFESGDLPPAEDEPDTPDVEDQMIFHTDDASITGIPRVGVVELSQPDLAGITSSMTKALGPGEYAEHHLFRVQIIETDPPGGSPLWWQWSYKKDSDPDYGTPTIVGAIVENTWLQLLPGIYIKFATGSLFDIGDTGSFAVTVTVPHTGGPAVTPKMYPFTVTLKDSRPVDNGGPQTVTKDFNLPVWYP